MTVGVAQILTYMLPLAVFVGVYAALRRREEARSGHRPPIQWGWLAAIAACAGVAAVAGLVL
jgi:hypothetical protein